jgi:hypothetical protein
VLIYLWIVGFSNAINLTDGLDGLAVGCTITVALVFGIMAYAAGNIKIAEYLLISYVPGHGRTDSGSARALIGACMAFLWFNSHPAEVFMGDTGSLALGGLIGVMAFMIHQPFTLVIVGGVFVMEALSVIIQVGWFKYTKRRTGTGAASLPHGADSSSFSKARLARDQGRAPLLGALARLRPRRDWRHSSSADQPLLAALGATAEVYDAKGREFTAEAARRHGLVLFSPGFAPEHPWLRLADAAGGLALGELDFASLFWRGRVVAITGTNGKTTLTEFLVHALRAAGETAHAAGNIGRPAGKLSAGRGLVAGVRPR